jgi:hypothetical protein
MSGTCNVRSVMSCTLSVISYTKTSVVSILYPLFLWFLVLPLYTLLYWPPHFFLWFLVLHLIVLCFSVLTSSVYMYVTMYKRRKSEQLSMQTIIFYEIYKNMTSFSGVQSCNYCLLISFFTFTCDKEKR